MKLQGKIVHTVESSISLAILFLHLLGKFNGREKLSEFNGREKSSGSRVL
jgi:hypothetical protein